MLRIDTKLVHAGETPRVRGAVITPIFQSAMYETEGGGTYHEIPYIRHNNTPNHAALHAKLAALENAESALVAASGMAVISAAILANLRPGGHLLAQRNLYGGTHDFLTRDLAGFGLSFDFIDADRPETWKDKLRPETRAIYVETISNPLMQVPELEAVAAFARAHGLVSMIDNTFATPVNFRPIEHGFDLSLHSCTKYLNGHSDIVGGAVLGRAGLIHEILAILDHLGGSMDPHACFLLQRGLKTLALRVRHQNQSALAIARFLENHPALAEIHYPGLESHPGHVRAASLFQGFGGMMSFELKGGEAAAHRMMERVTIPIIAPSLGGVESLMTRPAVTSHVGLSREDRMKIGIGDGLVRFSVGIEAVEDLISDLDQALAG